MAFPAPPLLLLQRRPAPPARERPRADERDAEAAGARLACYRCLSPVTDGSRRIAASGSHAHRFVNPHGIEFEIGCFASAPGCIGQGASSSYWSWFPGFAWRVALCVGCREHLGWSFRSAESLFFGLILERLVEVLAD